MPTRSPRTTTTRHWKGQGFGKTIYTPDPG